MLEAVRSYLSSYRRRRRVAWLGGLLLVAAVTGLLVVAIPSPTPPPEDDVDRSGEAQVFRAPRPIRITPRVRREVDRTVDTFVRSAVLRRDLERSWRLASPDLKASASHADWMRGDLPVFPYPADPERTEWDVEFADAYEVALNVTLVPREGVRTEPQVFGVSLEPVGDRERRRFLVAAWYPRGGLSTPQAAGDPPPPAAAAESEAVRRAAEGQIDRVWWLVPAGMLALIVLGPLAYFGFGRLRRRAGA